ncbi:MAG: DEAD/DEAH box helicase family protein [Chloroflexi bacterium]|nr:DEAD/DEAH box helicase family protein [Chloroflexota bacterium]
MAVDRHEFEALMADDLPGILVQTPRERDRLLERWGLRSAAERVRRTVVAVPSGPANLLTDEYPGLRWHLADDAKLLRLQRCSTLRLEFLTESGRSHVPKDSLISGEMLYIADWLDEAEGLGVISEQLRLGLTTIDVEQVLDGRRQERRRDLLVRAREQASDGARLLALIGADAIRRELPRPLLDAVEDMHGELSDAQLGEVALAMFGTDVLRQFRSALQEQGLEVPVQWAGSRAAVQFVLELGFTREYAGLGSPVREPTVEVDGPLALPELHEFQRTIADRIRALLKTDRGARRALLSLPTGAGKTRIAVQAVVEAVCEDGFAGPLLWVADRDELCEQAVQSWIDVWRSVGPPERLHISRFWSSNETGPIEDGVHVIVATIQKLRGALDDPSYAWLPDVACLVVDEAHGSVGPEYTELLNRLGLGRSQRRDEAALLGLTATPFRGVSESETERLAARYGRRRLDVGILGGNPEQTLQTMGVLAAVDHRLLPGEDIELTDEQMDDLRRLRRLPAAVEETLGASVKRNLILLDSLRSLPEDWPVLFFATSVAHAQTMAALLSLEGIPAAAVSSETAPGARRSYVERFRRRELRVLTNYGVLTQGFDAPAVRALYIARPTYSPNLYQQMIGRGLRGPLNGGKERCLVVNVEDNVRQFGERLAFHHFDYLWDSPDASNGLE